MSLKVDVTVTQGDLSSLNKKLAGLVNRSKDLNPYFQDAGQYMVNATQNRILRTKKGPDGKKWAPLSQATIDIKGHSQPLFQSGRLASSIHVVAFDKSGFIIASDAPYAELMQNGFFPTKGFIKGKKVPARPFMGISDRNLTVISSMLREYVAGRGRYAGGYGDSE